MADIPNNDSKTKTLILADRLIVILSAIGTVFTLGWVLWSSHYGIDFSDEGQYLVWMSNPFIYGVSLSQFGFIYHPLYKLLEGNIAALRQANILITFCLAWALGTVFLKTIFGNQSLESTPRVIISGAIATASLMYLDMLPPTPSYNTLALQALLVAATGLTLAGKNFSRASITGWSLIGIGGWLAFMAKPTTAAALGLCSGFYLLSAGKFSIRLLAISLATAAGLVTLTALTIDGSIITFIDRLVGGLEMARILGGGHTLAHSLRLDNFHLVGQDRLILIACTALIFSAAYFSQAKNKALRGVFVIISITFALVGLAIVCGLLIIRFLMPDAFRGILIWSIPFAAVSVGFALYRFKGLVQVSRPQWALALTLLAFPHVYAFGTGCNYWLRGTNAAIFWVFAGFVLLSPIISDRKFLSLLLPLGLAVQLVTVALIQTGFEAPYRQPQPLREYQYELEIGKAGSTLVLSNGFGQYITEATHVAKQAVFKKGTPMIDLTGQSPSLLYAMGAKSIGQAWTIGGYPGSDKLAVEMLKRVSCEELAAAWLLWEPDGPRKISPEILSSFGANMATDFVIVGTFNTAEGAGGYEETRVQQILKPLRPVEVAIAACKAARESQP